MVKADGIAMVLSPGEKEVTIIGHLESGGSRQVVVEKRDIRTALGLIRIGKEALLGQIKIVPELYGKYRAKVYFLRQNNESELVDVDLVDLINQLEKVKDIEEYE